MSSEKALIVTVLLFVHRDYKDYPRPGRLLSSEKALIVTVLLFVHRYYSIRTIRDGEPWTATLIFTLLLNAEKALRVPMLLFVHRDYKDY